MKTLDLPESKLVKNQRKTFGPVTYTENGETYRITAEVRYDDECGNGHNSFSITGTIKGPRGFEAGGCLHDEIAKHFPGIAPYIKWHLCGSDGPMHYVANTVYHADKHGPTSAWVYYEDAPAVTRHCVKYCSLAEAETMCQKNPAYTIEGDHKTAKIANLEHARSAAIWPEATDEQLCAEPEQLKAMLLERLPVLMVEFKQAVESFGFTY